MAGASVTQLELSQDARFKREGLPGLRKSGEKNLFQKLKDG